MASSRPEPKPIHVFIASPGDLAVERWAFKQVIDELNGGFADGAGVRFVALGWEDTLATSGRRPQGVINQDIDRSDVFVLAVHRRWGQPAPDAHPYTSYTEEEFHRAMDRWKATGSPEIFVFFKPVDPRQMADPGPQLKKVLAFRKSLEDSRQVLYRFFQDEKAFAAEVDRHLRAYARGQLPKTDAPREAVVLPLQYLQEVTKAKTEAQAAEQRAESHQEHAEAQATRADKLALDLAEQAAAAAREGQVEQARQTFARAHEGTNNLRVLNLAYEFYHRTGDLKAAEDMLERWLSISGREAETGDTAAAYGNLGLIYRTRGELDRAEETLKKALAIEEKLGRQDGMASAYGNLGNIYRTRGEIDRAEEMHKKSLAIEEKLGREEGMAAAYGNLGNIYQTRGELDRAEEMHKKALVIEEKLARPEGMARQYGNLGLIYQTRGELDRAEEMLKKSLAIHEKLGRPEGMAIQYGNLGVIYQTRDELDRAEEMHKKSLAINEKLGRPEGMAIQYGNLGAIYQTRGELDRAEEVLKKALVIDEKLGRQAGMANQYDNLGLIYQTRGDLDRAEEMHRRALAINDKLGWQEGMANAYRNLGSVAKERGKLRSARELLKKARGLYEKIGLLHMVKQIEGSLDGLLQDVEGPQSLPATKPMTPVQPLRKVFVSYSHHDKVWLEAVKIMLRPVLRDQKFELWDDSRIKPGSQWKEEIKRAINSAQVAVLLVSKHFLASEFIAKDELPPLLSAAKERGVTVLWVCVGHCLWHLTAIEKYQAAHTPPDPLNGLNEHEQDRVIKEICEEILRASGADFRKD